MSEEPFQGSVRDLIDMRAAETPDSIFLIDPTTGQKITYAQLQDSAQGVTEFLHSMKLEPSESVAYAMTNGAHAALTILGIMYGGFLATAVNLVAGKSTIGYVLEHSDARLVFYQNHTLDILTDAIGDKSPLKLVEVNEGMFRNELNLKPAHRAVGADAGLLMYTSGTTGTPKGVVLTQAALLAGGSNTVLAHQLTGEDRGLCVLPLYHINGLCVTVLGPLVSGGSTVIPQKFSVSTFWNHLRNHAGSWFSVVPTQISYLLQAVEDRGHDPGGLEHLRFGRSASAPLSPDVQRKFEEQFQVPIIETMGLTETAAQILSNPMKGERKIGSPGIAYGNEIKIVDERLKERPRGGEGEVLVRGANVMREYYKNPKATSEALTSDGWLRTGDLGRMDEDGYVFITGRLKELIIKGGENIAPREIDDALYGHPDVVEAAAFARDCDQYGQRVEAGVMLTAGSKLTPDDLIALCQERLGSFKSPDQIHVLAELPKGPSGKIQRLKVAEMTMAMA